MFCFCKLLHEQMNMLQALCFSLCMQHLGKLLTEVFLRAFPHLKTKQCLIEYIRIGVDHSAKPWLHHSSVLTACVIALGCEEQFELTSLINLVIIELVHSSVVAAGDNFGLNLLST